MGIKRILTIFSLLAILSVQAQTESFKNSLSVYFNPRITKGRNIKKDLRQPGFAFGFSIDFHRKKFYDVGIGLEYQHRNYHNWKPIPENQLPNVWYTRYDKKSSSVTNLVLFNRFLPYSKEKGSVFMELNLKFGYLNYLTDRSYQFMVDGNSQHLNNVVSQPRIGFIPAFAFNFGGDIKFGETSQHAIRIKLDTETSFELYPDFLTVFAELDFHYGINIGYVYKFNNKD